MMQFDLFAQMREMESSRSLFLSDAASGLQAIIVLDNLTLGPAAGGIRTRSYPDVAQALADAQKLARAMTIKNALAGLDAGGGKAVVMAHPAIQRHQAFAKLGAFIEELGGLFHTAGDFGTTQADLQAVASQTRHVETGEHDLAGAVADGVLAAMRACLRYRNISEIAGKRVLIQGCGAIGSAVARKLAATGAEVRLCDLDAARASELAAQVNAATVPADAWLDEAVDIFCPCALGGMIDIQTARKLQAKVVCGAANNVFADQASEQILVERGISCVPDVVASAGAVIEGIGKSVMGLQDCSALLARIGDTATEILQRAAREQVLPSCLAETLAFERIRKAGLLL